MKELEESAVGQSCFDALHDFKMLSKSPSGHGGSHR